MIAIYFKDPKESFIADSVAEWCTANGIQVSGFYVDANEGATEVAEAKNLTVFPVIVSIGNYSQDGTEQFVKYAEGLDAILALTPDVVAEIKKDVIPSLAPDANPVPVTKPN